MKSTYGQVLGLMKEVEHKQNTLLFLFAEKQVKKFVTNNQEVYNSIRKEMEDLSKQFMVTDPKSGNIITEGVGTTARPVFKEGFTLEMYTVAFNDLMDTECHIKL